LDLTNAIKFGGGFDETANGILIETRKNHKDWYAALKKIIQNPEMITILQENLYNTVKDKYSMNSVTEQRKDLYLQLTKTKKPELWLEKTI
jgi:glycosyltransferase involved in cell wall biosynthesis